MSGEVPGLHGQIVVTLAVYDRARGWLGTRRSVIYGGRHGKPPMIEMPIKEIKEILDLEVESGLRAMQHRWFEP